MYLYIKESSASSQYISIILVEKNYDNCFEMSCCFPTATENKECKNSSQIFHLYGSLNVSAKNPIFLQSITAKIKRENHRLHTVMKCKDMARNMIIILLRKNKNLIFGIYN